MAPVRNNMFATKYCFDKLQDDDPAHAENYLECQPTIQASRRMESPRIRIANASLSAPRMASPSAEADRAILGKIENRRRAIAISNKTMSETSTRPAGPDGVSPNTTTQTSYRINNSEARGMTEQGEIITSINMRGASLDLEGTITPEKAQEVFGVTELLEKILIHLDDDCIKYKEFGTFPTGTLDVLNCMRVSKAFKATIYGSSKLQWLAWLNPETPANFDASSLHRPLSANLSEHSQCVNTLLREFFCHGYFYIRSTPNQDPNSAHWVITSSEIETWDVPGEPTALYITVWKAPISEELFHGPRFFRNGRKRIVDLGLAGRMRLADSCVSVKVRVWVPSRGRGVEGELASNATMKELLHWCELWEAGKSKGNKTVGRIQMKSWERRDVRFFY